jgi:hypothetical protein
MANEVQDPIEDEATEQPTEASESTAEGLSEQDQDALFDTLVSGEPEQKPEEKPSEEPKPEEKPSEQKAEEPKPVEKTSAEKAQEAETAKLAAEAEAKASAPIEYKDFMPSLRKELAGKVLPVLDAEGKETGRTADINDLLETYEDDIVPLITAIMNSSVVRSEMGKGKKAEAVQPQAIPQEFQATVNDLVGRTNLMTLCMALAAPKNGGHFDAYDIAVSDDFNQWLSKQSAPVKTKANTGGVSGSKEVLEMYKTAKGLMEDPAKKVQRQQAQEEDDLLGTSSGNRGSGGVGKKAAVNEADLDMEFEAFSERHKR